MIASINKSASISETSHYLKKGDDESKSKLLFDSLGAKNNKERNKLMKEVTKLNTNPKTGKKYLHISLSFSPREDYDDYKIEKIARIYLDRMNYTNTPYQIYRHYDRPHPHVHIVLSRVNYAGKVLDDSMNYMKSMKVCEQLEQELNLQPIHRVMTKKRVSNRIVHAEKHDYTKNLEIRDLWEKLDQCKVNATTFTEYQIEAKRYGIQIQLYYQQDKPKGISYSTQASNQLKVNKNKPYHGKLGRFIIKGSKLGRGYTLSGLSNYFEFKKRDMNFSPIESQLFNLKDTVSSAIYNSKNNNELGQRLKKSGISMDDSDDVVIFHKENIRIGMNDLHRDLQRQLQTLLNLTDYTERRKKEEEAYQKAVEYKQEKSRRSNENYEHYEISEPIEKGKSKGMGF